MSSKGKTDVQKFLFELLNEGIIPYAIEGPILSMRVAIQDDPLVCRSLGLKLRDLKKIFIKFCANSPNGLFDYKNSALNMFEMDENYIEYEDHYWHPLLPIDIWEQFIYSMMTILDEDKHGAKYESIVLPEFYEFLARCAFIYYDKMRKNDPEDSLLISHRHD